MTEEQIERAVEHKTDVVDKRFMAGKMTQEQYDEAMKEINAWSERMLQLHVPLYRTLYPR